MTERRASEALIVGRRALEGIPGYRLLDDLAWCGDSGRWLLRCRLTIGEIAMGAIPAATDWCVLIEGYLPFRGHRNPPCQRWRNHLDVSTPALQRPSRLATGLGEKAAYV